MKNTLILIILSLNISTFAQIQNDDFEIIFGKENIMQNSFHSYTHIIGQDMSGFYIYKREKKNRFIVEHLNNKLEITNSTIVNLEHGYDLMFVTYFGDKIYVFSEKYDKQTYLSKIYITTLNKYTLNFNNDIQFITTINSDKPLTGGFLRSKHFDYSLSPDSSKLCLIISPDKHLELFFIFNHKMELLWNKKIETQKRIYLYEIYLENNGDLNVFFRINKKRQKAYTRLDCYSNNGADIKTYNLKSKEYFIYELKLVYLGDNKIICAGFYGEYCKEGTCVFYIDKEQNTIMRTNFQELSSELLMSEFNSRKRRRYISKNKKGYLCKYKFDYLNIHEDNSLSLVAEKRFTTDESISADPMSDESNKTETIYHNENIIIIQLDSTGNIKNEKVIRKNYESSFGYEYYSQAIINDKLLIFLDNGGDIGIKEILSSGKINNYFILSNQTYVSLYPRNMKKISENELLFWGERKRTQQFMKLIFK